MQVIRSVIQPGGHGGDELYAVAADVDVLHVLSGAIVVRFSDQDWELGPGDSLTFNGHEPHSWRAVGDTGAEVIWVLAPALWSCLRRGSARTALRDLRVTDAARP